MIKFVQTTNGDITSIIEFMEGFNVLYGYPFDADGANGNIRTFISNEQLGRLWLIQLEDKPIGYLALTFGFSFEYGGRDAFIDELYLVEAYRNKGYGTAIVKQLDDEAKALNVKAIHLEVEPHNRSGLSLYKKSGYGGNNRRLMTKRLS